MKKTIIVLFSIICMLPALAQYKITGNVTGVDDETTLYLTLVGNELTNIDSTAIQGGHFEFTGSRLEKPLWALIKMKGAFVAICDFYLDNGEIAIEGSRYGAKATGTQTNAEYNEYQADINSMGNRIYELNLNALNDPDPARRDSFKVELKKAEELRKQKELDFIRRYPSSPVSLYIAGYMPKSMTSAETLSMLELLSPELQQDEKMQEIKKRAEQLANAETGSLAPDFTLPTDNGGQLTMSSLRGKYVLLDFWASWCAPCRASFPTIAKVSQKYQNELTVVGVSLDRDEKAWRKALAEEKCSWKQVWDKDGIAAKSYAVSAIPLLVLVDSEGKIVGRFQKSNLEDELQNRFKK